VVKSTASAWALIALFASTGQPQTPPTTRGQGAPDFKVLILGGIVADFNARVWSYFELRSTLEKGLPALTVTDDPAVIMRVQRALGERVRLAREGAKQGEIFTPTISEGFRKVLLLEVNANTLAAIMDDNPGAFTHHVNDPYSKNKPLSTMPANLLAVLPSLPDDIQYRFLGHHLILHDTRANLILDRLPCAIQCGN
jgi:hypothetical protein